MNEESQTPIEERRAEPHRVRLPPFIIDQEVGLGDVIMRGTSAVGVRPCGRCQQRAQALNEWVVFERGRS
jgi:hypothetical protein